MTLAVLYKLLAIVATIVVGWWVQRRGWLAPAGTALGGGAANDTVAQVLGHTTMYLFIPALLFKTMATQDLAALPLRLLVAYFVPALLFTAVAYVLYRRRYGNTPGATPAAAATRTVAAVYGNAVQLGIPVAAALFGPQGLALHISLVSAHGVLLLTTLTVLAESTPQVPGDKLNSHWATLRSTVRKSVIHPVVLPVLLGLGYNLTGLGLHTVADQLLQSLAAAVVPVSLVLIGVSLATYGVRGRLQGAVGVAALKLLVLPALVLAVAHTGFGLRGTPLAVLVMMAALPTGTNALVFAQRYRVQQAQASVAIVVSTLGFTVSAGLWLVVLGWLG
jgi:malonate transporter and related proteins